MYYTRVIGMMFFLTCLVLVMKSFPIVFAGDEDPEEGDEIEDADGTAC